MHTQITGNVYDSAGKLHYTLKGFWDETIHIAKILEGEGKMAVTSELELVWENVPSQ